jgi:hypothetical protein
MSKNQFRLIGLACVIIAITLPFLFDNNGSDFATGLLIGFGIIVLITGRIIGEKSNSETNYQKKSKSI